MPLQLPDPAINGSIRDHWLSHRCLPFPAGSLVPREHTQPGPGAQAVVHGEAVAAADFAAQVLVADCEAVRDNKNPRTLLTTLVAQSAVAFATRHADLLSPEASKAAGRGDKRSDGYHPGAFVLASMWAVSAAGQPDARSHAGPRWRANAHWDSATADVLPRLELRLLDRNLPGDKPERLPYAHQKAPGQGYGCTCQADHAPERMNVPRLPRKPQELAPVHEVLKHPGAEWWLLGRFFLAVVHAHIGWLPYLSDKTPAQVALQRGVLRLLLRRQALPQPDEHTGVAVGLAHGLQWQPGGDGRAAVAQLPAVLTSLMPHEPQELARHALRYLGSKALGIDFFEAQLPAAMALARDLAADFTSPALAQVSADDAATWGRLNKQLAEVDTHWLNNVIGRSAARHPDAPLNARFARDLLMPRRKSFLNLCSWMHTRGHNIVARLQHNPQA